MTTDDPNAPVGSHPQRRSPRQGIGGSPVGSTLSIVLAVVAVVAGFLILRNITDDNGSADGGSTPDSTLAETADATLPNTTKSTAEPPLVTEGASVIVANASGVQGSAGRMSEELAGAGFEMGEPTNATSSGLEESIVYYDPSITAATEVAESVARVMGDLAVEPVPTPVPVEGASLNGAGVVVILGVNQADKTLAELAPAEPTTVTSPAVSGDGSTTDSSPGTSTG